MLTFVSVFVELSLVVLQPPRHRFSAGTGAALTTERARSAETRSVLEYILSKKKFSGLGLKLMSDDACDLHSKD